MKKTFIVSLALGLGLSFSLNTASAYKEVPAKKTGTYSHKKSIQQKLNEAIYRRYRNRTVKHWERNGVEKNRLYKEYRHKLLQREANVNERSTKPVRTGEFRTIPDYRLRKQRTKTSLYRPTWRQTFRARAIDYYVDGGDAGVEAMSTGAILGSRHRVRRVPTAFYTKGQDSSTIGKIRNVQKAIYTPPQVGAGQQRERAINKANMTKVFMHPFMPDPYADEE